MPGEAVPLLEREAELERLGTLVEAAAEGRGGRAVVEGPAGAGKTAVLLAAAATTGRLGVRALVARAAPLERDLPFGIVRQLFEPPLVAAGEEGRRALLAGAAGHAAGALGFGGRATPDTDPLAAVHGLHWLAAELAAREPLLLVVDDLQWADEPSARALAYLARRVDGMPIALAAALLTGEPLEPVADALLAELDAVRVRPAPLGEAAVRALLEAHLGTDPPADLVASCHAATGGNPLLVAEVASALAEGGDATGVVPERVEERVRRRLGTLGDAAGALAHAVAVLGDGNEPGLAGALAHLDAGSSADAADRLVAADVLVREGEALRFRHPLVREAVGATLADGGRGRLHARAARLLADRGARAGRIAGHVLASPPGDGDPWAVEILREAARLARRQGAPDQAIAPLRRALAEPPRDAVRPEVLRELGQAELGHDPSTAIEHLAAALEHARDPLVRADVALELGVGLYVAAEHAEATAVLRRAIDEVGAADRERALRLEAFLGVAGRYDLATEAAIRGRLRELADGLSGETPGERLVLAVAAAEDPGPSATGLAHAAELQERVAGELPWPDPTEGVGTTALFVHAGRPDRAAVLAERLLEDARRTGSPLRYAMGLFARALVHLDVGTLEDAEADARAALDGPVAPGTAAHAAGTGQLAHALAERGRAEEAWALLAEAGLCGDVPEQMVLNPLLHARLVVALAQERWADAAADAAELGRRHERWGIRRPSPNWRAYAAEALARQGDADAARAIADEGLALAEAWGTAKAIGVSLRAAGLARAREAEAIELLAAAHEQLAETPWRLDRARAAVDLGAALRRAGRRRDAREVLTAAMDEAARCGAPGLAGRAATELRATGARPRRHAASGRDALTASERRVAELAAAGRSNREIAQYLFVTVATVETHLRRVYRKLGIAGRSELEAVLAAPSPAAPSVARWSPARP